MDVVFLTCCVLVLVFFFLLLILCVCVCVCAFFSFLALSLCLLYVLGLMFAMGLAPEIKLMYDVCICM